MRLKALRENRLFRDSFWALSGNVVGKGLSLVAGIVIARLLGREMYGEYGMIKSTLVYIAMFSTFGLGQTSTKHIADFVKNRPGLVYGAMRKAMGIAATASAVMAVGILLFAEPLAEFVDAPHLAGGFRILSVIVVFNSLVTTQTGILAGFSMFRTIARNNIITGAVIFIGSCVLTYLYGFEGSLVALLISQAVNYLVNFLAVQRRVREYSGARDREGEKGLAGRLARFATPIAMTEGVYSVSQWLFIFILIRVSGYGELALFSASDQWASIILFVPGVLKNVTLSHLSSSVDEPDTHNRTINRMLAVNFVATFVPFLVVAVFSNFIVSLYGPEFTGLRIVMITLVASTIFNCLSNVYMQELISRGRTWLIFGIFILRSVGIAALMMLLSKYAASGEGAFLLSLSMLIVYVLILLLYFLINRHYRFLKPGKAINEDSN